MQVLTSKRQYEDYVEWGESRAWAKGAAAAHTYNAFTQQLAYTYASNKAPGQARPPMRVKNIGLQHLSGWEVDWACLHKELERANFMSAGADDDDDDDVLDMGGMDTAGTEDSGF